MVASNGEGGSCSTIDAIAVVADEARTVSMAKRCCSPVDTASSFRIFLFIVAVPVGRPNAPDSHLPAPR